ncbi:RNA polymerase sigma factor [Sediminitomix flava]|uniref:RNA polymerase sigma factor (Sigma-70 family) n=1 Tax=Sediminitomix flava TaxID=379075 RepID=A0A315ZCY5_SEDFL|nr:sigma-70 family RNA polymerase sigma factor [Sediminitomix flava]PWJ43142.1 RNA polymerase sigma factor (sigma-70 family) [Sediminitomix flava]
MKDSTLWQELKEGNAKAFKEIFDTHVKLLYKYGYKFCQDPDLVDDCIQDIFMRIWEKRSTLGTTDNIKFYLMVTLKRAIYQKILQKKKLPTSTDGDEKYENFSLSFSIEEDIIKNETDAFNKERLLETLNTLPKRQKEVIYLRFYMGLSYEETAELMELNYQSVRNLQSTALKNMKGQMGMACLVLFLMV